MNHKDQSPDTICVHGGTVPDAQTGGVNTPIYASTSFAHPDNPRGSAGYPRYCNIPTQEAPAARLAALEGAQAGLVVASGLGAIFISLLAFAGRGDHVVFQADLYGGTHHLVTGEFQRLGIEYTFVPPSPASGFKEAIQHNTRVIYVETPSNPLLQITDIASVARAARERGLISIIDNTFATPINQRPLQMGIDVAVHSATKYLNGHSDINCGAVTSSQRHMDLVKERAINFGVTLNVMDCFLLDRGLKTLALRMERHNRNGMELAGFLAEHPRVRRVYYPGLPSHPGHELAREQMSGFGGMLSFELDCDAKGALRAVRALRLISPAVSLGGVESLVCFPALTSHENLGQAERRAMGISDSLIRFSVGVEHSQDLMADLEQAFKSI